MDDFQIRKLSTNGDVTTIAGMTHGFKDGKVEEAQFSECEGIIVDSEGSIFISDTDNNVIRKISNGIVVSLKGINHPMSVTCLNGCLYTENNTTQYL